MQEPALGMLEFRSVAKGIVATDAVVKKAPVRILQAHPISPGKYMLLFAGEVGDVEEALAAGVQRAGDSLIARILVPFLDRRVLPALAGVTSIEQFGSVGIIETFSVCTCIYAADKAVKTAEIELVEIRLAQGLGGKGYFVLTGELPDVEAALEAAAEYARGDGMLAAAELIPAPHAQLIDKALYW